MKICIFAKSLPVHIIGGMERHVKLLIDGLVRRGHKVTVITGPHPKGIKKEENKNLTIHYLKSKPSYTREMFYIESAKLFGKIHDQEHFDIVHSQSTLACGYVKYSRKIAPLVITCHGTSINEIKTILKKKTSLKYLLSIPLYLKYYFLDDFVILNEADRIIAVSNELKEDIVRQYKIAKDKITVIPNGIDPNRFRPMNVKSLRKRLGLEGKKVILSVGRIHEQKGFHLLIKIFPEILREEKNVKLVIIGSGPYLQRLKRITLKLGISKDVLFTGKVPEEDLPKFYNLADIFAFPTLRMEGLPLVVPEAMACEKPVITSRIGGIPTVIENSVDGILIKPGNLKELKERIMEVLRDEELAKKLGKNARKKVVERFGLDRMVEDTIKVYEEVLGK